MAFDPEGVAVSEPIASSHDRAKPGERGYGWAATRSHP
jgi:hypothetical protein